MATRMAARFVSRRFSSGGKVLSEEEKAAENVYIKVSPESYFSHAFLLKLFYCFHAVRHGWYTLLFCSPLVIILIFWLVYLVMFISRSGVWYILIKWNFQSNLFYICHTIWSKFFLFLFCKWLESLKNPLQFSGRVF